MLLMLATISTGSSALAAKGVQPPCDLSKSGDEMCADFCNYKCSFYNSSMDADGSIKNKTLYRITPPNVTGIKNKDTGDAPGDISFWLSKKNLTQQCARDPTSFGCFLDGDNLYGAFVVEMSTEFGPYFECNPVNVMGPKDPYDPLWVDTREFMCGQGCLFPTHSGGCNEQWMPKKKNGTTGFGGAVQCWCDGTARHNKTVGVELMPFAGGNDHYGPSSWPAQCSLPFMEPNFGNCVHGRKYKEVKGWSFASTLSLACEACSKDDKCQGWATLDNETATLFEGHLWPFPRGGCVGGLKHHDKWHGGSWGNAGNVGGYWYSTPVTAECKPGEPVGTNGCSWRVLSAVYKNASCIDKLVDSAVEKYGKVCFDMCAQPLNSTSTCYLYCYRDTLLGYPGLNISKMPKEEIIGPWEHGFVESDPSKGGCPEVTPQHCEGSQCGPPSPSDVESLFI